jgi:TrmH family RNA methyltransferase
MSPRALTLWAFPIDYESMSQPLRITSRQNQRVKDAARLRTGSERQRRGRIIIDGAREIYRAVTAGIRGVEAYVCVELCQSTECEGALTAIRDAGIEMFEVTPDVFAKLAFGDREDGVVLIAEKPRRELSDLRLPSKPVVAVVEGVEKPGNLGAILRSADAAGIDAVVVADARTDLFNPNTIRASLGTVFRENVHEATSDETLGWLRGQELAIIAARPDAKKVYTDVDLRGGVAIVLGNEAAGLSDAWRGAAVTPIRLPMLGIADSLNVSTTAAVLFYEALRQRGSVRKS